MTHWAVDSVFYHIYPLGLCGAPPRNDFHTPVTPRLEMLHAWVDHLGELGANAVYLGPLFESSAHGYDTADYFHVDRRLGERSTLAALSRRMHGNGIRLVLDAVFNHVGRDFWAFRHLQAEGQASPYAAWFDGLDFGRRSPYGDPFAYQGWSGHYDLVKLNLRHPAVREHLFQAVEMWVGEFDIDGLRLDAADCLDFDFLQELAAFCRRLKPDFWLLGEVVHGDYRRWANPAMLDSVTNYEVYKSLYSSHAEKNYYEIAYALNRQFGDDGVYRGLALYNFADNHDVNRVASNLTNPAHLYPLYCLMFGMPGTPSIYYGSEWGLQGRRDRSSDRQLRPSLDLQSLAAGSPQPDLPTVIARLASIRRSSPALCHGDYCQLYVGHEQLAFARRWGDETVLVAVNSAGTPASIELTLAGCAGRKLVDLLNPGETFAISAGGRVKLDPLWPCWGRILRVE